MNTDSFEPNPNIERDVEIDLSAKAQTVVDAVVEHHPGESQAGIRGALDRGLSEIGIPMPASTLDEWAASIARGDGVKVDIRLA